ncbi:MAG: carbon storage regulator CsrA [Aureliella sp.]
MLVLSRKKDQSVFLGGNVEIVVVEIRGDKVRLGIKAPDSITVYRSELLDAVKRDGTTVPDLVPALAQPPQNSLLGA